MSKHTSRTSRELVAYFRAELRRLARANGELSSPCVVYKPRHMVVRPQPDPRVDVPMSLPACLIVPDTAAGVERFSNIAFGK